MQLSPVPPQRQAPVVIPDDVAVYRVKDGKFFGPDDTLYPEGSILAWDEEPNTEMQPLNDLARTAMKKYLKKLDGHGRDAARAAGKSYTSLADAYENSIVLAQQEGKRVRLLNAVETIPLMGAKKNTTGLKKLDLDSEADPVASPGKGKFSLKRTARDEVNEVDE